MKLQVRCLGLFVIAFSFAGFAALNAFESTLTGIVKKANVTDLACTGQKMTLLCDESEGIKIKSAFWGRDDPYVCSDSKPIEKRCKSMNPNYPRDKLSSICDSESRVCEKSFVSFAKLPELRSLRSLRPFSVPPSNGIKDIGCKVEIPSHSATLSGLLWRS
ncbi:predicted protein [Nematostella vectensis]|uniref:Uncharacterized protein n=1 Tax=Nematostella vectensis TaxID=45351 RepID=A7RMJ2_NEMVE|nr:predicted protein [Nematostella vectensis]|eukprot:XP_001639342.1 predicted protein [Nematostella vectensis]